MDDWKKYDDDLVQTHDLLPWGCTLYELSHRINHLRKKYERGVQKKEVSDLYMKDGMTENRESVENKPLAPSLFEQEDIKVSSQMLAKLLNKSIRTIQRMAKDGRLPASREEGNLVWMSQDLEEILRPTQ